MDALCVQMMSPEFGLPVKGQKYFRTYVPASFTGKSLSPCKAMVKSSSLGNELIEWLISNLLDVDQAEALHLANQLCIFGYVFPVFEATGSIKEDNCLFRLQIPYFWPSHNLQPDNVEYAIFLSKRLLRNEEKHGLVEHEAESYQRLRELLGHMWDFIQSQAELQLKMFKEKKKADKVVFDSQEKAYWRIHRPPSKRKVQRTTNASGFEIDRLKQILKVKPWLKSAKSLETLVSWCGQFANYDPILTPPRDPANPWLNANKYIQVSFPTERRVRRWGFSIQELIKDPIGRQVLETFLESEFSQENIKFWQAVQDLKYSPSSEVARKVEAIYNEFLVSGAPCQVNVDSQTLESVNKSMHEKSIPLRYCFSQAEEHIFILMSKDSYPRFARSEIYKNMLAAAQQQGSKKLGWSSFLFNHGPLKKGQPTRTSPQSFYKNKEEGSMGRLLTADFQAATKKPTYFPFAVCNNAVNFVLPFA
ncbi:regulator of g protein signaling [Trichuris trichiura]|uniref:Regulator of g protein signaling n=1 Tax=Trichuris trichiura TaxID=36087 RepID=A0A077Z6W2_TRITR|nr:regulator of g protein signaling [Trichuris trichiura]